MKDYDFELKYHHGKTNKVANALIRKKMHTSKLMVLEHYLLEKFQDLDLNFTWTQEGVFISHINILFHPRVRVKEAQFLDVDLQAKADQSGFNRSS